MNQPTDPVILELIMKANNIKDERLSEIIERRKQESALSQTIKFDRDKNENNQRNSEIVNDYSYVNINKSKSEEQILKSDFTVRNIDFSKFEFEYVFENDAQILNETSNIWNINKYKTRREYDDSLPIAFKQTEIMDAIKNNSVCIIQGSTGCGKTTIVPQFIIDQYYLENKYCNLIVTQPSSIAATSKAHRVCNERKWKLGEHCGYQTLFDSKVCQYTRITYASTSYLKKKLVSCPNEIAKYSHIIIDDVHERQLDLDFVLLVLKVLKLRNLNSKLILMSNNGDREPFSSYFKMRSHDEAMIEPAIIMCTRKSTVKISYLDDIYLLLRCRSQAPNFEKDNPQLFDAKFVVDLLEIFDQRERKESNISNGLPTKRGSVLIFVPGKDEVRFIEEYINNNLRNRNISTFKLHSDISIKEQESAFDCQLPRQRKVIISTGSSESSITFPDIKYVIDFCLTREQHYNEVTGCCYYKNEWSSQAILNQRSDYVNQVNGECFRLISKQFYQELDQLQKPEIQRAPLEKLILSIKEFPLFSNMDPKQVLSMGMQPPPHHIIDTAVLNLKLINAITVYKNNAINHFDGDLTFIGRIMSALPIDCRAAKLILLGHLFGKLRECIIIAAAMSSKSFFENKDSIKCYRSKFYYANGSFCDFISIVNAYNLWRVQENKEWNLSTRTNERKKWFEEHSINEICIKDVYLLKKKLQMYLSEFNIYCPEDQDDDRILDTQLIKVEKEGDPISQNSILLKFAIAGAFYPHYYTVNNADEEEAIRTSYGKDPRLSVVVEGFMGHYDGILYHKKLVKLFESISTNVLITYVPNKAIVQFKDSSLDIPTKVKFEVYLSCFLRIAKADFKLNEISSHKKEKYLKQIKERQTTNRVTRVTGEETDINLLLKSESKRPIKITRYIKCGRFWALINDEHHHNICTKIYNNLNTEKRELKQLDFYQLYVGKLVAVSFIKEEKSLFFRARILSINRHNDLITVLFVDYGNTEEVNLYRVFELPFEFELDKILPQAFECELVEIRVPDTNTKNYNKANELFKQLTRDKKLEIELYSVINNKARVSLYEVTEDSSRISISQKLIEYVERCEESFESKQNHFQRIHNYGFSPIEWEPSEKIDEILNSIEYSQETLRLKYPENLLKLNKVYSAASNPNNKISSFFLLDNMIGKNSINCVLFDDEPEVEARRILVAGEIGEIKERTSCSLEKTCLMPKISGLNHILYMLFAPIVEFRLNRESKKITGALCGLGFNREQQDQNFCFSDHVIASEFDVEISADDIETINTIRASINALVVTQEHGKTLLVSQKDLDELRNKAQSGLLKLINKKRKSMEPDFHENICKWNQIDENLYVDQRNETNLAYTIHRLINPRISSIINNIYHDHNYFKK